jgi:hypothetical protein
MLQTTLHVMFHNSLAAHNEEAVWLKFDMKQPILKASI